MHGGLLLLERRLRVLLPDPMRINERELKQSSGINVRRMRRGLERKDAHE
jgi:hypothetical protein